MSDSSSTPSGISDANLIAAERTKSGQRHRVARARPLLDFLPAAILCVVAVFEIVTIARAGRGTGSAQEWSQAAERVREKWRVGDLVVFAPRWIDPVGRQHLGELLTLDDAARMDAARYGVVWELSIRGAQSSETHGRELNDEFDVGPIRVRRWLAEAAVVVTDFREALASAVVTGEIAKRPKVSLEEVGFEPHRCVLGIPRPNGTIEIRYADVDLGSELVGYVGLADVFTRRDVRDPGRLEVLIDGSSAAAVTVGVEDGWVRFSAPTTPGPATVTFRLSAVGAGARDRRICFAAEARR